MWYKGDERSGTMSSFSPIDGARHEYQLKTWQKMLFLFLGMIFIVFGGLFGPALFSSGSKNSPSLFIALPFLGLGVFMLAQALRSRLVIDGTRIEVRTGLRERSADRSEIEGFRTISTRNGSYTQLRLKQGQGTISIPNCFDTDDAYRAWFEQITNLDNRDREEILREISEQVDLGSTPEERLQALPTAKTWSIFLAIVTATAAAAAAFGPPALQPLAAAFLVIVPIIAISLLQRSPLLYAVFRQKADPRAELSFALMLSACGLLIPSGGRHFVDLQPLLWVAIPVALLYLVALYLATRKSDARPGTFIALIFFVGLYSFGLSAGADTLTDRRSPTTFRTLVTGKHVSHGRSTSYYLELAPWGPVETAERVSVSSGLYGTKEIGDEVCINLHPGSLHIPWFQVMNCASMPPPDLSQ
jgi:hypothetical protein